MTSVSLGSQVWFNGHIIPVEQALIPMSDRGFSLGDGLFETLLWTGTDIRFFDDHIARLADSAAQLGFTLPHTTQEVDAGLLALAQDASGSKAVLRLTLTRGSGPRGLALPEIMKPNLLASIAPFVRADEAVTLRTSSIMRHAGAPSAQFKTLSYIDNVMALNDARACGADDAVMLGTTGYVACATSANLIIRYQGRNLTPALEDGALAGIIRGRFIRAGIVEAARISPAQLATCDVAVLTNALIGVREISCIDGRRLSHDALWFDSLSQALATAA